MDFVPERIERYCMEHSSVPSKVCDELQKYTQEKVPMAVMLTGPLEGSFLGLLIDLVGAKRVLEIGTFTGYSALAMAERLPDGGEVVTCDVNPETMQIAQSFWDKSPHGKKIKPVIGPALDTVKTLKKGVDLVFIDADKGNYLNYVKAGLDLLSPNGVVAVDNCLWSGRVLDAEADPDTKAIQETNAWVAQNQKLHSTLVPIRDGIMVIRKI